jgi:hypothetical protein
MKMVQKPRKSLVAFALASAIGGAMVSAPAQAVNLSPDNLGQVLVFPYYTAKNGFDSYIHLTNTSNTTVIAKIRFREAKNSREVRDFNVILSPYDVWTAAVTQDGEGAKLVTYDKSCTSPLLPASSTSPGATEVDFTSLGYDGSDQYAYDNGGLGLDRTQEGYFEVIAMGASSNQTSTYNSTTDNLIEYNAKHVNGLPRDCAIVDQQFAGKTGNLSTDEAFDHFRFPGNVLKGFSTLINVASGQAVGVEPTVFANFREVGSVNTIIFPPGDLKPDLSDVDDALGANYVDDGGLLASVAGANPIDVVSALLMRRNVINEFTSTAAGTTQTDWVLTFPTKHNYTDNGGLGAPFLVAVEPFDEVFTKYGPVPDYSIDMSRHDGKSCVDIGPTYYDREEATRTGSSTDFSPRPAGGRIELCNEVNVLSFNNSNVFGSGVRFAINTSAVAQTGWMNLRMGPATIGSSASAPNEGRLAVGGEVGGVSDDFYMHGLPVIGFGAVVRFNDAEAGNNRNYGVAEEHSFNRTVVPQ